MGERKLGEADAKEREREALVIGRMIAARRASGMTWTRAIGGVVDDIVRFRARWNRLICITRAVHEVMKKDVLEHHTLVVAVGRAEAKMKEDNFIRVAFGISVERHVDAA